MIIADETTAPTMQVPAPFARTLKVLLSPVLHPELKSIAAGLTILPPGGKSDRHAHVEGEMFFIISGRGYLKSGEREVELTAMMTIWANPGEFHQLVNTGSETLKILWVLSPPGREADILKECMSTTPARRGRERKS